MKQPHSLRPLLLLAALLALLAGCASPPGPRDEPGTPRGEADNGRGVNALLSRAETQPYPESARSYFEAARLLEEMGRDRDASRVLDQVETQGLEPAFAAEVLLLKARLELNFNRPEEALPLLLEELPSSLPRLAEPLQERIRLLRAEAYRDSNRMLASARELISADVLLDPDERRLNHERIWAALTALPAEELRALAAGAIAYELQGWYELALIGKAHQNNLDRQLVELARWQQAWGRHPAARQMPEALRMVENLAAERPRNVALLLPLRTVPGKVVRDGFMTAYFNVREIGGQVPALRFYDTTDAPDIVALHEQARANGAEMVIGPLQKQQVAQLQQVADLGVPTLALNNIEGSSPRSPRLYQFSLSPENEARQVAMRAWEDGHRYAAILSPPDTDGTDYYARKRESFIATWRELGGTVVDQSLFQENYTEVIENLLNLSNSEYRREQLENLIGEPVEFTPRRRQDVDFIFLIAQPGAARQIKPSLAYLYAGDLPVYATQDVYSGVDRPLVDSDLNGIRFGDSPWLLAGDDELREQAQSLFPQNSALYMRLQAFGVDAFRLYPRLRQLEALDGGQLYGATGLLRMDEGRNIHQQLSWAVFQEGLAKPAE